MNAVILVNPHAGKQALAGRMEEVRQLLEGNGHQVRILETDSPGSARDILAGGLDGADTLICGGGDGTLSETIHQVLLLGTPVRIGYLPGGTTNDFARFLHIPRDPAKAVEFLLETAPKPLDVGQFGDRHFIYVASFGVFTKSSYATDPRLKQAFGHFAYVLESLRELPELKAVPMAVETAEGEILRGNYIFGAVSDSTSIGGVLKPDPAEVNPADGKFELVLVKEPHGLGEFNRIIGSLISGRYDPELITFTHTAGAAFTCPEPVDWSLDGEYAPGGERVEIQVLPRAVEMYY